ncbi:hypothetical protein [Bradyrhizobium sp. LA7.1]|uniref:hypothetical protein n=1 Tax=Bradyrhizobium sp. LA7.1 TaxID=3156324 RepID=UPI003393DDB7
MSFTVSRATMARVSKDVLHKDIARRYKAHGRGARAAAKIRSPIANLRLVELERIFGDRFGKFIPNSSAGRAALQVLADGFLLAGGSGASRCIGFVKARAPWAMSEIGDILDVAAACCAWQSADKMAWRIQLSATDRDRLRIRTIGAVGMTARQRRALAKAKKIELQAARREASGATPRGKSLAKVKPWTAAGISRATWYRRLEKNVETISVPISNIDITRTEIVSRETLKRAREPQAKGRAMEIRGGWGSLLFAPAGLKHSAASRRPSPAASALIYLDRSLPVKFDAGVSSAVSMEGWQHEL